MILGFKIRMRERLKEDYYDLGFRSFASINEEIQEIWTTSIRRNREAFSDP